MASIHEILESMRPDFQAVNALLSKAIEGITELIVINKEFRANLDDLRLIVSEMGHEESETKNGDTEEELQSCFEGDVKVESDVSTGNRVCSEMGLVLGKPSVKSDDSTGNRKYSEIGLVLGKPSVTKIPQILAKKSDGHPSTVGMVSCSFWVRKCNTEMVLNAGNAGVIACLRKQEIFCSIFEFLSQNLWDPGGKYLHIWAKHLEKLLICSRICFYGNNTIHELEIASHRYGDIPIGSFLFDFVIGKEYGVVREHEFVVNPQIQRILVYMYAKLGLWDCARKVFGEMLGPYLATDITILNATVESLVLLVVVYIQISMKFHLILNFFSIICPIIVNNKCPSQSFMQLLARQHSLLRAAFEQFNLIFFEAHCTHISLNEASKVAAPRKKIVEKINVVEVELLVNNLMFVEAKDKIEIAEFQLQLLEFEEAIVAMLGEAMNVNQCFENRPEPNMHCVGRILEQQIGISSLGHSFNLSFFLVQSFKAIASKLNMLNLVTTKNNGVKMGEGLLADHMILRGRVTWAAMVGSCLYISCFYKFWDPGGFCLREGVIPVECEFTDMLLQSRIPFTSSSVNLYPRKDRLGLLDCACDVFDNTPDQYWEYRNTVDIIMGDSDEPDISSA